MWREKQFAKPLIFSQHLLREVRAPVRCLPSQPSHTHTASHTDNLLTHNFLTHTQLSLSHTQLSLSHTQLSLTHTTLSHTQQLSHTQRSLTHTLCVAGVVPMALGCLCWRAWVTLLFVWQAWHLEASTSILCGRRGTW